MERRLRGFYDAYYSELRQWMSRYPTAPEIFPYYLRGPRRIVVTLAQDGFLAVHYPAERDSFEFGVAAERRVTDLTGVLTIVLPNGYRNEFFPKDPENPEQDFDGATTLVAPRGVHNDQEIRPDYVRADAAAAHAVDEVYTEEKARKQGESDAMLAADAYLMGLERVAPEEKKDRVVAALENAIDQFEQVVNREPQEWMIQEFLTIKGNQVLRRSGWDLSTR